ncbi:MAG: hypothetical protein RIC55_21220 [Pirellulaceae bacterium]
MVLLLIRDVAFHPGQIVFAKANDAEPSLPLKPLGSQRPIDLARAGPFQVANEVTDADEWFDVDSQMDMRRSSSDGMQVSALGRPNSAGKKFVHNRFERGREQSRAAFGVPVQVQKDFMEHMR